ncbi:hypothetical protein BDV26DRAFT_250818 [Aspergillus bertholletiae]|uniref:Secreted protein n=1 Tax=Aspergillus bertholletiae TaxID=1226010 RepID=A0A5N7BQB1_9EURO|nr:hypothetical protein BDV26DRAFT_250818 [Aspergillus bertholletiae]
MMPFTSAFCELRTAILITMAWRHGYALAQRPNDGGDCVSSRRVMISRDNRFHKARPATETEKTHIPVHSHETRIMFVGGRDYVSPDWSLKSKQPGENRSAF